jgi:hypothetical protein
VGAGDRRLQHPDDPRSRTCSSSSPTRSTPGADGNARALIRKPIKELVEELDADLFWQIHRSTLVNTRAIAGVTRDLRGAQLVAVRGHPESSR